MNTLQVICLLICGTNMGLAIIQLNAGIGTVSGMEETPQLYIPIIIFYTVLTFLTFSDGVAFSFPMLLMKKTELDASKTRVPKVLNVIVALFMGALTVLLLFAGGYDALSECMVVVAFPVAIVLLLMCLSVFKFLFNREKYDVTYQEELAEEQAREQAEFDEHVQAAARSLLDKREP